MKDAAKGKLLVKGVTRKQLRVVELVVKGFSNSEVATILELSEKSIKFHLNNIYKLLGLKSRMQLIVMCLTDEDPPTVESEKSTGLPVGRKQVVLER